MKKAEKENVEKEILFYTKKLPPVKKVEALDFIKWLWLSKKPPENYKARFEALLKRLWNKTEKEPISEEEVDKIVEEVRLERHAESSR